MKAVKLSITRLSSTPLSMTDRMAQQRTQRRTERVVTVAERCSGKMLYRAGSIPEREAAGTRPEQRRRCAVVIDRDPEVVRGLAALLMPELEVQSTVCPLSAAQLLDRIEHVDLAFVELELPDFAGEQLLQQLGRWPDAIRVLLTQQPRNGSARGLAPRGGELRGEELRGPGHGPSALATPELPRNAYLAHLVLSKPISAQVVRALQRATLGLLRI